MDMTILAFATTLIDPQNASGESGGQGAMAILMLVLLLKILALGGIFLFMAHQVVRQRKRIRDLEHEADIPNQLEFLPEPHAVPQIGSVTYNCLHYNPPQCWIAVHSTNLPAIEAALELKDPIPCNWDDANPMESANQLFIAPPTSGWTLVFGNRLQYFAENPDKAFHFFRRISQHLGNVQYFSIIPAVHFHCWVNADRGQILRAYNWNGSTSWNQGTITRAEKELKMAILNYGETHDFSDLTKFQNTRDHQSLNVDKIYQLAGLWGLNPLTTDLSTWHSQLGIRGSL